MMSTWTVLTALPFLVEEGPAPEDVKAGWLGFSVWIALVVAVVILGFSLRKQLKRVDFEEEPDPTDPADPTDTDERTTNGTA
jgi:cytoskeletal protein RodZ